MWLGSGGPSQLPSEASWAPEGLSKPKRLSHPIFDLFSPYFIEEIHMLPFLYLLWYIPAVNVWTWTSQNHQKCSLGRAAGQPDSFSLQLFRPTMTFTRLLQVLLHLQTAKHTSTFSTFTQQREDMEQTANARNGEKVQRKAQHGKPGAGSDEPHAEMKLSAFEARQQLTQAARNNRVPPWQGVSHPQNRVCSADLEKSWFCQLPLTWSLRGSCAEIKSWGYSESHWTQSNNIVLLVKPKSLCL